MSNNKKQKNKKNAWLIPVLIAALVIVALAVTAGYLLWERGQELIPPAETPSAGLETPVQPEATPAVTPKPDAEMPTPTESPEPESSLPIDLGWGLMLTEVKSYAGLYLEDGSDEVVSGIMMVRVKNMGSELIQLANITAQDAAGNSYSFQLTTLLPGAEMTVLESGRAAYSAEVEIVDAAANDVAVFSEVPSMHEDILSFECSDYTIKVKNISEADFPGGRVFYKSVSGSLYIGGITYTVTIPALGPGEETVLSARHYYEGASALVFVTYAG